MLSCKLKTFICPLTTFQEHMNTGYNYYSSIKVSNIKCIVMALLFKFFFDQNNVV
jgi:hypothetical protein